MNIKRAFFAVALMVPGLAFAQSDITIPTSVNFTPEAASVSLDVTATCNSGTPLSQTTTISEAVGVTFSVLQVADGSNCEVTLAGIPDGWEVKSDTGCDFTTGSNGSAYTCAFEIGYIMFDFDVDFVIDDTAEDATFDFDYTLVCENVMDSLGTTLTTTQVDSSFDDGDDGSSFTWTMVGVGSNLEDSDSDVIPTNCYVKDISTIADSTVEVTGCTGTTIDFGDDEGSCTLTATVFYEGIPTLSQYGMAIMVLLMLGVGFVGFRRFV